MCLLVRAYAIRPYAGLMGIISSIRVVRRGDRILRFISWLPVVAAAIVIRGRGFLSLKESIAFIRRLCLSVSKGWNKLPCTAVLVISVIITPARLYW